MSKAWQWMVILISLAGSAPVLAAVQGEATPFILRPAAAANPPQIDGRLDDEIWKTGPILDQEFTTYNPMLNETA